MNKEALEALDRLEKLVVDYLGEYGFDQECAKQARKNAETIRRALESDRWHKVGDDPPPERFNIWLLVTDGESVFCASLNPGIGWVTEHGDGYSVPGTPHITYWRPLPEPPKDEPK